MKLHVPVDNGHTGRAYCGPTALSAITGRSVDLIVALINKKKGRSLHYTIRGTNHLDMYGAAVGLGWDFKLIKTFPVGKRPTLSAWLRDRSPAERDAPLLVGITFGKGHWVAIAGDLWADSLFGYGSVSMGPGRSRVTSVHVVRQGERREQRHLQATEESDLFPAGFDFNKKRRVRLTEATAKYELVCPSCGEVRGYRKRKTDAKRYCKVCLKARAREEGKDIRSRRNWAWGERTLLQYREIRAD